MHSSSDRMANHSPSPCISPSTDSVMLASRHSAVRIKTGRMDMDISKQLQLPLAAPFSSAAPYRRNTWMYPLAQRSRCRTDWRKPVGCSSYSTASSQMAILSPRRM